MTELGSAQPQLVGSNFPDGYELDFIARFKRVKICCNTTSNKIKGEGLLVSAPWILMRLTLL